MSRKSFKPSPNIPVGDAIWQQLSVQFTDTDPQMLYALWAMESGADPDQSLREIEGAVVAYDKFRPRLSRRKDY
ncbi:hypothetical protein IT570_06040 [Candidatus Sumerlaeota bacterium]|nr:hypothetical protein [Candidatus Sumerlaeota bacterium]